MRILILSGTGAGILGTWFGNAGHSVEHAPSGSDGLATVGRQPEPDAVIVRNHLPDMTPTEVANVLRRQLVKAPILVVGDMNDADSIAALDAGADDRVPEATSPAEIDARLRAIVRRARDGCSRLRCGDVSIDLPARTVHCGGEPIELTPREFALLELLARQCDRVVPRSLLRERIWGPQIESNGMNVVDVYVSRLRRKLDGDGQNRQRIRTIPGTGYMLLSNGCVPGSASLAAAV